MRTATTAIIIPTLDRSTELDEELIHSFLVDEDSGHDPEFQPPAPPFSYDGDDRDQT